MKTSPSYKKQAKEGANSLPLLLSVMAFSPLYICVSGAFRTQSPLDFDKGTRKPKRMSVL